jgi:ubiquinone/menaquinone biosynthesis C-methylase UbiE
MQERAFALLYGWGAGFYDRFSDWLFLGEWTAWQQTSLAFLPERGTILEIGCGTGRLARGGIQADRLWVGLDASPDMLANARRRGLPGLSFVRGDAGRLPLADKSVDAIVSTFPARYILDPAVAAEMARVLEPDGPVVVVLSGTMAPHGLRRRLRRCALRCFYGRGEDRRHGGLELAGFAGRCIEVTSAHGTAELYVFVATA